MIRRHYALDLFKEKIIWIHIKLYYPLEMIQCQHLAHNWIVDLLLSEWTLTSRVVDHRWSYILCLWFEDSMLWIGSNKKPCGYTTSCIIHWRWSDVNILLMTVSPIYFLIEWTLTSHIVGHLWLYVLCLWSKNIRISLWKVSD